jgi:hypothetical protein
MSIEKNVQIVKNFLALARRDSKVCFALSAEIWGGFSFIGFTGRYSLPLHVGSVIGSPQCALLNF